MFLRKCALNILLGKSAAVRRSSALGETIDIIGHTKISLKACIAVKNLQMLLCKSRARKIGANNFVLIPSTIKFYTEREAHFSF